MKKNMGEPDRHWRNSDGKIIRGYDSGDGYTDWYMQDGSFDSRTKTPEEWEQDMNDEGY